MLILEIETELFSIRMLNANFNTFKKLDKFGVQ